MCVTSCEGRLPEEQEQQQQQPESLESLEVELELL